METPHVLAQTNVLFCDGHVRAMLPPAMVGTGTVGEVGRESLGIFTITPGD